MLHCINVVLFGSGYVVLCSCVVVLQFICLWCVSL